MTDNTIEVGKTWDSIADGRMAVFRWAVDNGLSFSVKKADKQKWLAVCRDTDICNFRIRISVSKKRNIAKLTVLVPHTCPAATHRGWRAANSVKVLASNPKRAVQQNSIDDDKTSIGEISDFAGFPDNDLNVDATVRLPGWNAARSPLEGTLNDQSHLSNPQQLIDFVDEDVAPEEDLGSGMNSDEDDVSSDGSELRAQWAISEDPDIAQLSHYIEFYSQQLRRHLEFKARYPKEAAERLQRKKRNLALNIGIGHRLTKEQYLKAIGEDYIREPPAYPQNSCFPVKRPFPRPSDQRLDPTEADLRNPLRLSNGVPNLQSHDPECRMSKNPHQAMTASSPSLTILTKSPASKAATETSSASTSNIPNARFTRTRRVGTLTEKGRVWVNEDRTDAKTRTAALKRARAASEIGLTTSPPSVKRKYRKTS